MVEIAERTTSFFTLAAVWCCLNPSFDGHNERETTILARTAWLVTLGQSTTGAEYLLGLQRCAIWRNYNLLISRQNVTVGNSSLILSIHARQNYGYQLLLLAGCFENFRVLSYVFIV